MTFVGWDQLTDGDAIIHLNFRSDRARQLTQAIAVSINPETIKTITSRNKDFMIKNTRESDLALFYRIKKEPNPKNIEDVSLILLMPAFIVSELRTAFEIGFLIFLPFLIIDIIVASILMSLGMMMLPPVMISLPIKIIFFIIVDGWLLIIGNLAQSFK